MEFESQTSWKIQEFHRELKQLTGIPKCQFRDAQIPKNHIACAMLVWHDFKKIADTLGKTIYQLKHQLLSKYLVSELKHPAIKIKLI